MSKGEALQDCEDEGEIDRLKEALSNQEVVAILLLSKIAMSLIINGVGGFSGSFYG